MELLSYAETPECIAAAVQSGADSVCVSVDLSGAIGSLTDDDFSRAAEFCRVRGVKLYVDADLFPDDSQLVRMLDAVRGAWLSGADGVIASDPGLIYAIRQALPDMPVFAGPGMNIHGADGLKLAAAMGIKRAFAAKELNAEELNLLCASSPVGIIVPAHGHACASFGGQCLFSAFSGDRERGRCSAPCLAEYATGTRENHPLSLSDICLIGHTKELSEMGVSAICIDGRRRRPEYVAMATSLYSRVLGGGSLPDEDELALLQSVHPSGGLSDGFFTGSSDHIVGAHGNPLPDDSAFLSAIRKGYLRREFQRVPVSFRGDVAVGCPLALTAADDLNNIVSGEGGKPDIAFHRELTATTLQTELYKTGGTPFYCENAHCSVGKGLSLRAEDVAELRDRLLAELMEKRKYLAPRTAGTYAMPPRRSGPADEPPMLTVSVESVSQLSSRLAELAPPVVYVPLEEIPSGGNQLAPFFATEGVSVCAVMPRVITDHDTDRVSELLMQARQMGVREVLCGSLCHIMLAHKLGFDVRGDFGLNVLNSQTMALLGSFGLKSVTLSPELSSDDVAAISKPISSELIVYGRLPLMLTGYCIPKNVTGVCSCESFSGITDKNGFSMPTVRTFGCRNTVYSSKKLFLAGRSREYMSAGLWGVRLSFTTENANECAAIAERFLGLGDYEPVACTYGNF